MLFKLEKMINKDNSKTIDTLPIVKDFLVNNAQKNIIIDPWEDPDNMSHCPDEENPYLRIIDVNKGTHYRVSVVDVPKQADGNLVITYYKGYYNLAEELKDFLNKKGINAEIEPFKK